MVILINQRQTDHLRLAVSFITGVGPEASDTTFAFYSHQEGELIKIKTFYETVRHKRWFWDNQVGVSQSLLRAAGWCEAAPRELPLPRPEAPDPRAPGSEGAKSHQ